MKTYLIIASVFLGSGLASSLLFLVAAPRESADGVWPLFVDFMTGMEPGR